MSRATRVSPGIGYMLTFCKDLHPFPPLTVLGHGDSTKKYMTGARLGAGERSDKLLRSSQNSAGASSRKRSARRWIVDASSPWAWMRGNKSQKRRHYNLLLAWWIARNCERQSACLDVRALCPRTVRRRLLTFGQRRIDRFKQARFAGVCHHTGPLRCLHSRPCTSLA